MPFWLPIKKSVTAGDARTPPVPEAIRPGQRPDEYMEQEGQETQDLSNTSTLVKSEQAINADITDESDGIKEYEKQIDEFERKGDKKKADEIRKILAQEKQHKKMLEGMEKGVYLPAKKSLAESSDDAVVEKLAEAIHNMWCGWSVHAAEMVSKETRERWEKMWIAYNELPEIEKEKDRIEARGLLDIVNQGEVKKSLNTENLTQTVHDYLMQNYPEETLDWVKKATWKRVNASLSKIKMARRPGGRNTAKVEAIAKDVEDGKSMDPIVLVKTKNGYEIADGYHRTLGFKHAGKDKIRAYVAEGVGDIGPWQEEMHQKKLNKSLTVSPLYKSLSKELQSKVDSGGAHWVTVKEGPLEGRHILINGPRPSDGKSKGEIIAGQGIPPHVIHNITGATHANHLEHASTRFGDVSNWNFDTFNSTISALKEEMNERIQNEHENLKRLGKQGVEQGGIGYDQEGNVVMRWPRMSQNPKWYQDLYRQVGHTPSNADLKRHAIERLENGYMDHEANHWVEPNKEHLQAKQDVEDLKTLRDIHIRTKGRGKKKTA